MDHGLWTRAILIIFMVTNHFCWILFIQSLHAITLADNLVNGIQTKPKGVGKATPLSFVTLYSFLYFPGFPFNLASVSRLTRPTFVA